MAAQPARVVFREVQQFRQMWIWLLMSLCLVPVMAIFAIGLVTQLAFDKPWGSKPMSDLTLVLVSLVVFAVCGGLLLALFLMRLVTEVTDDSVLITFLPLARKKIALDKLASCEARKYNPIREYGGWGIKYRFGKGWAYNVSGSSGVQLLTRGNKKLLIGSQRAEELARAVNERLSHRS